MKINKTLQAKINKSVLIMLACCTFQTTAMADGGYKKSRCDVVTLNGTGTMLPGGVLVGSDVITIIRTGKTKQVDFTMTTLGVIDIDKTNGGITLSASHDFKSTDNNKINFTTFDEITIVPLGGSDATCTQNACGLIFKLKLEDGRGRYNCGEIVSGYNTDPTASIPFTSYVNPLTPTPDGGTVVLNSVGKLCKCSAYN